MFDIIFQHQDLLIELISEKLFAKDDLTLFR